MSTIGSGLADLSREAVPAGARDGMARLWPALASPFERQQPLRGFDVFGERVRGWFRHGRAGAVLRRHAERIVAKAASLSVLEERAFDESVEAAREVAARSRVAATEAAFAVACEAVRREVGLSLYIEQVMGALAMANGCCAELATGEGKTVTAVLPATLDAWAGRGVHVITVNDYLAQRDATTTARAYRRLGLSVGVIQEKSEPVDRRRAYACSVTYAADKQVIFDFLRDRLCSPLHPRLAGLLLDHLAGERREGWDGQVVQRGLHAAIVDEADSVLIDEAVTPAIIGQDVPGGSGNVEYYRIAARIAGELERGDYDVDRPLNRVSLTERGRSKLAALSGSLPPFWAGPRRREELVTQALAARELYRQGDEYIVRDGKIVIVDRSTGRVLEGRQWQLGVHQAVEAKEGLDVTEERRTTARISYQRFFQRYRRLSGMTGTAWEVRGELWGDYHLPVVRVPTHRPVIRAKAADRVFLDEQRKFEAVVDRVVELHGTGRPVLIGTRSVLSSERLGMLLGERGVSCRILNATREAEEAAIVAEAGRTGAVTVATNMAGRGTDILLDDRARELGGLVVIATERHDESRVDRQLYGRAGRQGDPGRAEPFVSLDDALIRRNGLRSLAWLCRLLGAGRTASGRLVARVLWAQAQWTAGRRAAVIRAEVAKADAWVDLAMHTHSR
jgi:preprotein translocase subunit SecA